MLVGPINSGAAVGSNGAATSTGAVGHPLSGAVWQIQVKYNDSPPAGTTVVTVKTKGTNAPSMTLLTITNAATNGVWQPRMDTSKSDATLLVANNGMPLIEDDLQVVIAGANAGDNVDVYLYLVTP